LGGKLNHQCASVYELPFADNSFDGIRAERFFMHLEHPAQAMREIKRIAKPGAKLVFVETDWGSMSVNFGLDKYERQLSEFYAIEFLNNGFSARNMRALLQQIGAPLQQCFVDPIQTDDANLWQLLSQYPAMLDKALEAGLINPTEHTKINGNIKHWNHSDQFFCTVNVLSFAATLNN
ncbi:MAG: methyltransferase domain-containing protein, partial [Cellvibrionaceae bacterium]|nr:methyltransferase domain-containing protein [Cellvibrionaceae bacterium]